MNRLFYEAGQKALPALKATQGAYIYKRPEATRLSNDRLQSSAGGLPGKKPRLLKSTNSLLCSQPLEMSLG